MGTCPKCYGEGIIDCPKYQGHGKIIIGVLDTTTCPRREGRGYIECPRCGGEGHI